MALVSPGISISINDQSQYVNANVGSVPLVILATAQDKTYNGAPATGTSKANAGKLLAFSGQRDLVTQMGTPTFQISSSGTPINGSEINEYGLMTAYSALGLSNQLFAIRADIDLDQLIGTSVRPDSPPADGTYWLDTINTVWGINVLNATTNTFSSVTPLSITNAAQVYNDNNFAYNVPTPIASVGNVGQYAMVLVNTDGTIPTVIRLFYKASANSVGLNNTWVQVGSANWQNSLPVVTGTIKNPTITASSTLTINTITVTTSSTTTVAALAASINSANIPGVSAAAVGGQLELFATSAAASTGGSANGKITLTDGTNTPLANCGITVGSYYCPYLFYGSFAQAPTGGWYSTDTQPRPSGSIWWKTTSTGQGFNPVLTQYSSASGSFVPVTVPLYANATIAINAEDPVGGGANIAAGTTFAQFSLADTTSNNFKFTPFTGQPVIGTGGTPSTFTAGNSYTVQSTAPGTAAFASTTITLSGTTATSFVSDLLAANIPYVTASVNANGTISISHTSEGQILLTNVTGTPLTAAGFVNGQGSGFTIRTITGQVIITNITNITGNINYQASAPYAAPATGTFWYYSEPADVDIMINNGNGWYGYKNVSSDVRGYNLGNTDPEGVIVTATVPPATQTDSTPLVAGDLWLDSGDLANFPSLYRYNGRAWVAIDNTDHVSANGIIFADARWDSTGTTDVVAGALPSITTLLTSNYIDQDAPDYRLYARGTLLFNMRRSGYNVKKFVPGYFNATSFPNLPTVPGASSSLPTIKDAWVTASGLNEQEVMNAGSMAQRQMVVDAMEAAVSSNLDVLSPVYNFNLICAPGYPELIPDMVTLNDNRGATAFVIADAPMDLAPNTIDLTNYFDNTMGGGLPQIASPYLGVYYPAGLTNDLAGNQVVVPASHAVLRTFLYNDQVAYPWFAPAGTKRGLVDNLSDIGYIDSVSGGFVHNGINQGLRDALFGLNVNVITQLPNVGLVVFAQQTRSGTSSAQSRVNVARLENYLRTIFASISTGYLFEPNDQITRKSIAREFELALNNILALRGLYDFLVICDTSNNTPFTISNDQLYVDVAIEPIRDVEFIYIPIAIYNPGSIKALGASST